MRTTVRFRCGTFSLLLALGTSAVLAQTAHQTAESSWSFATTVTANFPGGSKNFLQPTVTADNDHLHLEARYNYEALNSGSAWVGYNFSAGTTVHLDFTAMAGGVFGNMRGFAPGYEFTLGWRKLELYSEVEYVFDTDNSSDSFLYTWSELTLAPAGWFQFGVAIQRTKLYQTGLDIQRGPLVRFNYKNLDLGAFMLDPQLAKPTYGLEASVKF